jgi:hypothetical protein
MNRNKRLTKELMILNFLSSKPEGATSKELSNVSLNYTSDISALRRKGHIIDCRKKGDTDTWIYTLLKRTSQEKYYLSAWEEILYCFNSKFGGCVEGEDQLKTLFKIAKTRPYREHNFYKDQMKKEYEEFQSEDQMNFDLG